MFRNKFQDRLDIQGSILDISFFEIFCIYFVNVNCIVVFIVLLQYCVDLNIRNIDGKTVLDLVDFFVKVVFTGE